MRLNIVDINVFFIQRLQTFFSIFLSHLLTFFDVYFFTSMPTTNGHSTTDSAVTVAVVVISILPPLEV